MQVKRFGLVFVPLFLILLFLLRKSFDPTQRQIAIEDSVAESQSQIDVIDQSNTTLENLDHFDISELTLPEGVKVKSVDLESTITEDIDMQPNDLVLKVSVQSNNNRQYSALISLGNSKDMILANRRKFGEVNGNFQWKITSIDELSSELIAGKKVRLKFEINYEYDEQNLSKDCNQECKNKIERLEQLASDNYSNLLLSNQDEFQDSTLKLRSPASIVVYD